MREQVRAILTSCAHQFADSVEIKLSQASTEYREEPRQIKVSSVHETVDMMSISIAASGLSTWIIEYGAGSWLDIDSPYLEEYIHSNIFNKERIFNGLAFLGRKKGDVVYNLDGTSYLSSGKLYGKNLEHMRTRPYHPSPPQHVIEYEKEAIAPQVQQELSACCLSSLNAMLIGK